MKKLSILILGILLVDCFAALGQTIITNILRFPYDASDRKVPQILLHTGGAGDWEDAASMQMWLLLHKSGKINLRGVGFATGGWRVLGVNDASIEAMSTLFDYYQVNPGQVSLSLYTNSTWGFLPIDGPGSGYTTNTVYPTNTQKLFTWYMTNKAYGRFTGPHSPYESTLDMFRRELAGSRSNSITFCINTPIPPITQLFDSTADQYSPLTGEKLFNSKVNQVTIMAGDYTNCTVVNGEYNISTSTGTAYSNLVARITRPITWIGFGLGRAIPSSAEPTHLKSMPRGWRLLSTANPLYDLAYQNTTTGDTGRSAWGAVNAIISGYQLADYSSTETNIYLTLYTNSFITSNSIYSSVSNTTVVLMSFYNRGYNVILPNGSNYWNFDGLDHKQRYLSSVNTNVLQWLIDSYNYTTQFDPVQNLFNNNSTVPLGIGTATPTDRVDVQMSNSFWMLRSDGVYAKMRYGVDRNNYAEDASQGTDRLFSSGINPSGMYEFYQGPFSGGSSSLRFKIGTSGGVFIGAGGNATLEGTPKTGELFALSNIVAASYSSTDYVTTATTRIDKLGIKTTGVGTTNAVTTTGITNTASVNRQVLIVPTATAYQIKNAAGTVIVNVPSSSTALVWTLQANGGAVTAAGNLAGTLFDW